MKKTGRESTFGANKDDTNELIMRRNGRFLSNENRNELQFLGFFSFSYGRCLVSREGVFQIPCPSVQSLHGQLR